MKGFFQGYGDIDLVRCLLVPLDLLWQASSSIISVFFNEPLQARHSAEKEKTENISGLTYDEKRNPVSTWISRFQTNDFS
ncbi:hypothetical protein MiSe_37630 [Microseira wollei NIES-4236]|uniref:Uncharacterized protein n=1 Tax=Microseira wollei NIES-4236 TaxID=2530354 RepID=A0AAV3XA09_9CYAN|nr:hypothetical protein MiSe_37630 [Microseira wollei NIES-4236]